MQPILVDEGAGKGCGKSRILANHHDSVLFCGLAAARFCCFQSSYYADVMPPGCAGDFSLAYDLQA
jgi:hypothetical protein